MSARNLLALQAVIICEIFNIVARKLEMTKIAKGTLSYSTELDERIACRPGSIGFTHDGGHMDLQLLFLIVLLSLTWLPDKHTINFRTG